jgi:hypothetical protein
MLRSVYEQTLAFAAQRDLKEVQQFLAALPDGQDRTVQLLGARDVDLAGVREWIIAQDSTVPVQTDLLEPIGSEPAAALKANRAVAALQCGQLLLPDVVDATAAVIARPRGTFAVVLIGADVLSGAEDLELVQRGLWRVLLGDPGVDWAGQDLTERACLLWSDSPVSDAVTHRVAADMRRLRDWIIGSAVDGDQLAEARAHCALELAERELARRTTAMPKPASTGHSDLRALCKAVGELRSRLLSRLDADLAAMEMQIAASLQTLEQDLLVGAEEHLTRYGGAMSGPALTAAVSAYLAEGGRAWRKEVVALVHARLERTSDQTADLLDGVDWEQVNAVARDVGAVGRYPDLIMERLRVGAPLSVPEPDSVTLSAEKPGPVWVPTLRRATYGGVAAAVSLVVLGPVLVPAVAAGALGAAGGALADIQMSGARDRRAAVTYARAAIAATMGKFASSVRAAVRQSTAPIRSAVSGEFDVLDSALSMAVQARPVDRDNGPHTKEMNADTEILAQLRTALCSAESRPEERNLI